MTTERSFGSLQHDRSATHLRMSVDSTYLSRPQDYYALHQAIPFYTTLGKLWGIAAKSWVASCVGRLKDEGYVKLTHDGRLRPAERFFERRVAHAPVRAGLPSAAPEEGY